MKISSLQNTRIKQAIKLRNKRERDQTQQYLIEGYRELQRAFVGGASIHTLFYSSEHFLGSNEMQLIFEMKKKRIEAIEVSKHVFDKLSYRDRPDGLLAVAIQRHSILEDIDHKFFQKKPPLFLIAESIEKPGNLGSILRSCDGTGVDALFICDQCTDIYNPNVVRASVGTLFTVPVIEIESDKAIEWLKQHKVQIVATSPESSLNFTNNDYSGPVAIIVGSEQLGLSKKWIDASDNIVSIQMKGIADSLNVAAATTLLLYEVLRQRS